jgi:micrococcal nuclease
MHRMNRKASKYLWLVFIWLVLSVLGLGTACSATPPTAPLPVNNSNAQLPKPATPAPSEEQPLTTLPEGKVTRVLEESVIEADVTGKPCIIRYIGADALVPFLEYNSTEYYAKEAYQKNYELVNGKTIRLEKDISEADNQGRLLRYVWVDDIMVNAELIRQGYAQVIGCPPDLKYYDLFVQLEIEAQHEGRGLWSLQDELDSTALIPGTFVGDIKSKVYHYSSCEFACMISEQNKMVFSSAASALARGYKPCKVCKPPEKICTQGTFSQ